MKKLEDLYGVRFFHKRDNLSWRAPILGDIFLSVFKPTSYLDIGMGIGDIVDYMLQKGVRSMGLEGSKECIPFIKIPRENLILHDLRIPSKGLPFVDLTTCFEVVEHVEEEYVDILMNNLCCTSNKILISAAIPGQGGVGHYNCQENIYWIDKFLEKGFDYHPSITGTIQELLQKWKSKPGIKAIYYNLLYFERRNK